MTAFVRMTGQDFNLGDTALRRAMLQQIGTALPIHAFVKDHSEDYVAALALRTGDVTYTDEALYFSALREACAKGPVVLFEKPGAFKAAHRLGRGRTGMVATAARVRASKGAVFWLGGGLQQPPSLSQRAVMRLQTCLVDTVLWRDTGTAAWFGHGGVMPDWAFAHLPSGRGSGVRRKFGISLRGERPVPSLRWLKAVAHYCETAGLEPVALSQVKIDNGHTHWVARELGCAAIPWNERTHLAQEAVLRDIYADCAAVVSDRLHVLILALTEGAIPCCLLPFAESKIARHFAAIGVADIAADVSDMDETQIVEELRRVSSRGDEMRLRCDAARTSLKIVGSEARALMAARCGPGA